MRTSRRYVVRLSLAALLAAAPLALSACDEAAEKAIEEGIEQAAEDDGQDVEVDLDDDGGVTIEGSDGTFQVGEDTELPEDFPADIPILDGELLGATSGDGSGGEGWYLTMTVPGSAEDAFEQAGSDLEGAGFAQDGDVYEGFGSWSDDTWNVAVTVGEGAGETNVSYVVSPVA